MPTHPRTTILARATTTADGQTRTLVVCPASTTLLVKNVQAQNRASATSTFVIYAQAPGGAVLIDLARQDLVANQIINQNVYLVLHPGDTLLAYVAKAPGTLWISGTLFDGVTDVPPAVVGLPALEGNFPSSN